VITELVTNAVEHGLKSGGTVTVVARRADTSLQALVRDDGDGLPENFSTESTGLGTQIVQALVGGDMRGRISWARLPEGGTEVSVDVTLHPLPGTSAATDPTPALIV